MTNLPTDIINKGAEAWIFQQRNSIIKYRPEKEYRHPLIDSKLRKFRTNREMKIMAKLKELNIPCPNILDDNKANLFLSEKKYTHDYAITMEFIDGFQLKSIVDRANMHRFADQLGGTVAKMHANDIVHGDLTTSNMIVRNDTLHLIDFGLSNFTAKEEDKAVDLHLLKEALNSKHPLIATEFFDEVIEQYARNYPGAKDILDRLKLVEKRGRNKH